MPGGPYLTSWTGGRNTCYPSPRIIVLTGDAHAPKCISIQTCNTEWSAFWALSVRSGRLRRSTGALCTVLRSDF
jgi:hypothetical protein